MAALAGGLIGGLIVMYMFSLIWELALFMRIMDDPVTGKLSAIAAAWFTAGTLGGFGFGGQHGFAWFAYLFYLVPAAILAAFGYRRGRKLRAQIVDYDELAEEFR